MEEPEGEDGAREVRAIDTGDVPECIYQSEEQCWGDGGFSESREDLEMKLERWRQVLEDRGMRISRSKTEYMCTTNDGGDRGKCSAWGESIKRVENFKYLGSFINAGGRMEEEVKHRVQAGWNNWRAASGVLCDKKSTAEVKGKFHKTVVRTAMIYGTLKQQA
ncbi:uncharacterized protein [Macrobrachium rosenbergii]|uniref:uncharacterized protein n=1 Tax=Macrobrachium rosenbergii TaxID=79674 RepID=UPI0034D40AD4